MRIVPVFDDLVKMMVETDLEAVGADRLDERVIEEQPETAFIGIHAFHMMDLIGGHEKTSPMPGSVVHMRTLHVGHGLALFHMVLHGRAFIQRAARLSLQASRYFSRYSCTSGDFHQTGTS